MTFERVITIDDSPDLSWLDQKDSEMGDGFESFALRRKEAYDRGDWHMIGVQARVEIAGHVFESPGLWGIESDAGESYLCEAFEEEKAELLDTLRELCAEVDRMTTAA
jgi:hypothetical protein